MIPSTELRLKTMMRAMTESILPALDPDDSLAQEQAGLMMGHINALIQQQGQEPVVMVKEQQEMTELATFLLSVAEGGEQTQNASQTLSKTLEQYCHEKVSQAVERLIAAEDATEAFKKAAWQPVLDYSGSAAKRGQQWFKPMGF